MIPMSLTDISIALSARSNEPILPSQFATNISFDFRDELEGSIFFAFDVDGTDGHLFLSDAKSQGAVAAVVSKYVDVDIIQLLVPDIEIALGELARAYRARLNIPLIGVTGSVGKTTAKEMIAHALASSMKMHKSRKNFNSELGVPFELLNLKVEHQASVVELAMRGLHQISYLTRIARPTIGIITNIGISHIGLLKSKDNVAKAKSELMDGIDTEGTVILCRDDEYYEYLKLKAPCKTLTFGFDKKSDYRIEDLNLNSNGTPDFKINGVHVSMKNCSGKHNALNAAICFAVADLLGISPQIIANNLESFSNPDGRGTYKSAHCGAKLIDASYNAAPDSVISGLETLKTSSGKKLKSVAVLGDMLELGKHSKEAHEMVGRKVKALKIDKIVTVGKDAEYIGRSSELEDWNHFNETSGAIRHCLDMITDKHIVFVQGSNAIGLTQLVNILKAGPMPKIQQL